MIRGSRPQTLADALNDSPVGLAAWMVEKFQRWSDCDGDLERRFSKDELLANVMVYWVTGTIGTSPEEWARRFIDVRRWQVMPRGGHFAAMEEPELLARELRAFFARSASGKSPDAAG